jgi:hypothetical protein
MCRLFCFDSQQDIWNESRIRSFAKSNPAPIKIVGRTHSFAIPPRIQTGIESYSNDHFPTVLEALEMGSPSKRQRPGTARSSSQDQTPPIHKKEVAQIRRQQSNLEQRFRDLGKV